MWPFKPQRDGFDAEPPEVARGRRESGIRKSIPEGSERERLTERPSAHTTSAHPSSTHPSTRPSTRQSAFPSTFPSTFPNGRTSERPGRTSIPAPNAAKSSPPELPKLWDEDEHTDVSRTTSLMPAATRTRGRPQLTIMTGVAAGRVVSLDGRGLIHIGRSRTADLRIDHTGISRIHCRIVRRDESLYVEDMESTNGTLVNGSAVKSAMLQPGDRIQLGPEMVLQFAMYDDAEELLARKLFDSSTRDSLTGAHNRRYFFDCLELELQHARRHSSPLSAVVFDIDLFKGVNDKHGHDAGDAVLRAVAQTIREATRSDDVFCRYGGEEFVLLLREPVASAYVSAERLRMRIEALRIPHNKKTLTVTVSGGVAEVGERGAQLTSDGLVRLADKRLYRAKSLGRNRVCKD